MLTKSLKGLGKTTFTNNKKADKGNVTIILDREDYESKVIPSDSKLFFQFVVKNSTPARKTSTIAV